MTKFAQPSFSVGATDSVADKAYRDNYDAVFGKKETVEVTDEPLFDENARIVRRYRHVERCTCGHFDTEHREQTHAPCSACPCIHYSRAT